METPKSDSELIKLCKANKSNFKLLYDKYSNIIYNFCLLLTKNQNDAEEIVQETFIKLYLSLGKFKAEKGRLKSYIFKIAQNSYINYKRKQKKTVSIPEEKSEKENILEKIIKNEAEMEILDFLKTIPLRDRTAFILNRIQKFSIDEITGFMKVSKQEVRNKIQRVKKRVVKKFRF